MTHRWRAKADTKSGKSHRLTFQAIIVARFVAVFASLVTIRRALVSKPTH
jgi:hypothetical protein